MNIIELLEMVEEFQRIEEQERGMTIAEINGYCVDKLAVFLAENIPDGIEIDADQFYQANYFRRGMEDSPRTLAEVLTTGSNYLEEVYLPLAILGEPIGCSFAGYRIHFKNAWDRPLPVPVLQRFDGDDTWHDVDLAFGQGTWERNYVLWRDCQSAYRRAMEHKNDE